MWLPLALTLIVLLTVALAVGGAFLGLKWGWPAVLAGVDRHMEAKHDALRASIALLRSDLDVIPASFETYQKEVQRLHGQAYRLVRRARKELADSGVIDPEIEGVAGELSLVDGVSEPGVGLQPVHPVVDLTPETPTRQAPMSWQARTFMHKHKLA